MWSRGGQARERFGASVFRVRAQAPGFGTHLFHLASGVVVGRHAAALLPDLHGPGLQQPVPDRPLGHVAGAIAADLHLDTERTDQWLHVSGKVRLKQVEAGWRVFLLSPLGFI